MKRRRSRLFKSHTISPVGLVSHPSIPLVVTGCEKRDGEGAMIFSPQRRRYSLLSQVVLSFG